MAMAMAMAMAVAVAVAVAKAAAVSWWFSLVPLFPHQPWFREARYVAISSSHNSASNEEVPTARANH